MRPPQVNTTSEPSNDHKNTDGQHGIGDNSWGAPPPDCTTGYDCERTAEEADDVAAEPEGEEHQGCEQGEACAGPVGGCCPDHAEAQEAWGWVSGEDGEEEADSVGFASGGGDPGGVGVEFDAVDFSSEDVADASMAHFVDDGGGLSDAAPDGRDAHEGGYCGSDSDECPGFRRCGDVPSFQ